MSFNEPGNISLEFLSFHPANDKYYRHMFKKLNTQYNTFDCAICRALNIMDNNLEVRKGFFYKIPWYLCFKHLPNSSKNRFFQDRIKKNIEDIILKKRPNDYLDNSPINETGHIGLNLKKEKQYRKILSPPKRTSYFSPVPQKSRFELYLAEVNDYPEQQKTFYDVRDKTYNKIRESEELIGYSTESSYKRWLKYKEMTIIKELVDLKEGEEYVYKVSEIKKRFRARNLLYLGMKMFDYAKMFTGELQLQRLFSKNEIQVQEIDYKNLITSPQSPNGTDGDCIWIGNIKYPAYKEQCHKLVSQSKDGNVSLIKNLDPKGNEEHYILLNNSLNEEMFEKFFEEVNGFKSNANFIAKVDNNTYQVPDDISPLSEYFQWGPVNSEGIINKDCSEMNYINEVLNSVFMNIARKAVDFVQEEDIKLDMNNLWATKDGTLYLWDFDKSIGSKVFSDYISLDFSKKF